MQPDGTLHSKGTGESIGDFVQLVGASADRPVLDKTGVTGYIDYDILITTPESNPIRMIRIRLSSMP